QDIGFDCRIFWRKPGFTAAAVLSLILGIGLNTAVFTLLDAVFVHPLPVEDPDSLAAVYVSRRNDAGAFVAQRPHSYPNYRDLRDENRSFSGLAAHFWWPMSFTGGSEPVRTAGMFVSANYFDVLGLEPAHGRFFLPEEDENPGSHPVVVLSHSCWARLFGSDPGVLGETVQVNGHDLKVVGVGPRGFSGTVILTAVDFWMPMMMFPELSRFPEYFEVRGSMLFNVFGRLREGVSRAAAEAEAIRFYENLELAYAAEFVGFERVGAVVRPLLEDGVFQGGSPRELRDQHLLYAYILAVPAAMILLIACLNVAILLLVQGLERGREIAIRQSLGADRRRLLSQLLTESLMLFLVGGALALPAGWLTMKFLWHRRPPGFGDGIEISFHAGIFLFAFAVALMTGLLFGLLTAVRASRPDLVGHLKGSGAVVVGGWAHHFDLRRFLVALQVAFTLLALIGAVLCLRSLRNAYDIDLGFAADSLLAVSFAPGEQGYDRERSEHFYRQVLERARAISGVRSATLSENRLLRGAMIRRQVFLPGSDEAAAIGERDFHRANAVAPGFFATAGITLLQGREFDESILEDGPPVVIVNRTMAETLWPGESAIGKTIKFDYPDRPEVEVIGVVRDAKYRAVREKRQFFIYLPIAQAFPPQATLHVRTEGAPADLLAIIRHVVHELDPELPLADVHTMSWFVDEDLWKERVSASLLRDLGVLALALATLGVYGVLAQGVAQRRREIGIRMAVGARRADLLRWVLADGARIIGLGIAFGLAVAVPASALAISFGFVDVNAVDPLAYVLATAVLAAVAFLGCLIPAHRAASIDPVTSLREE
ncbi:MAG: ABC transporter permease, partial [Thermoanaerobaculia bacterium]